MEVIVDYHFDGKREILFNQKGDSLQDVINLLQQVKDVADKHFTTILNEGDDLKEDPSKKKKTSENDLDGDDLGNEMEEENDQDNKIDDERN